MTRLTTDEIEKIAKSARERIMDRAEFDGRVFHASSIEEEIRNAINAAMGPPVTVIYTSYGEAAYCLPPGGTWGDYQTPKSGHSVPLSADGCAWGNGVWRSYPIPATVTTPAKRSPSAAGTPTVVWNAGGDFSLSTIAWSEEDDS